MALLAGFLFIGGGAVIYLSSPQQPAATATAVADASAGRSLDVFVQETPTPIPTPIPTPSPIPTIDPFATPTIDPFASPSPTFGEITPTPAVTPTGAPTAPDARFSWAQRAGTLRIIFTDNSTGSITGWSWDFGDGSGSQERNPRHDYSSPGQYQVVLTVTGPAGSDQRGRNITVSPPTAPTPTPTATSTPGPIRVALACNWPGNDGSNVTCTASAADGPYTWSVDGATRTDSGDGATATFEWTPPGVGEQKTVKVTVVAANGTTRSKSKTFTGPPPPTVDPGTPVPSLAQPDEGP